MSENKFLKACAFCYTQQQQQLQITNTNTNYKYVLDLLITKQDYRVKTKIKSNKMQIYTQLQNALTLYVPLSPRPFPLPNAIPSLLCASRKIDKSASQAICKYKQNNNNTQSKAEQ